MQIADPMLQGQYPERGLFQALAVAAMCVQEQPNFRPVMADVVTALSYLASQKYQPDHSQPNQKALPAPCTPPRMKQDENDKLSGRGNASDSERSKKSCWGLAICKYSLRLWDIIIWSFERIAVLALINFSPGFIVRYRYGLQMLSAVNSKENLQTASFY